MAYQTRHKIQVKGLQVKRKCKEEYSRRKCDTCKCPKTRKKDHEIASHKIFMSPEEKS